MSSLGQSRALAKMQKGAKMQLGGCSQVPPQQGWLGKSRAAAAAQGHRSWHYLVTRQLQGHPGSGLRHPQSRYLGRG